MKKIAILCFVFLLIAPAVFADEGSVSSDMYESKLLGQQNARAFHDASSWTSFGFVGGLLFGIIGGGASVGVAALSDPVPIAIPDEDEVDIYWYTEGYQKEARRINIKQTFIGAGAGVGVSALIIFILLSY